jgi:Skp family chaperone for outer membrane proteins
MLTEINNMDKKNVNRLKKKNKTLKDLELEINNKKNIISEEAFKLEVISFRKKLQDFTNEKNKMANEFNDYKKKKIQEIFEIITPVINEYMENNSLDILLDKKNIFIGRKKVNLTEELLDEINNKIK